MAHDPSFIPQVTQGVAQQGVTADLTEEQSSVLQYLLQGHNVFLTGGGGVGKSFLLSFVDTTYPGMKRQQELAANPDFPLPRVQLCALTGCASLLLGHKAKTIYSWAGIGIGKGTVSELHTKIRRNRKVMKHWLLTDLLVIDEISMMTAELLDKLDELGQKIRGDRRPFGGLQVLLVGDFCQLPPVNRTSDPTRFAFEAAVWKRGILHAVELTCIHRQRDVVFQGVLKEARMGTLSPSSCAILQARQGLNWKENAIRPTLLFPRRAEVELINETNLKALKGRRALYRAKLVYDGKTPKGFVETDEGFQRSLSHMDGDAAYAVDLLLIVDAQVMLIANTDPAAGLVNGSRGVVVGFCGATGLPEVEFMNGARKVIGHHHWPVEDYEFVSRSQIPLRLAWACTSHKAQGSSLESALVDIGSSNFEYGQCYVSLSRCRSLEALYVHDFDPTAFRIHPKVAAFYQTVRYSALVTAGPLVTAEPLVKRNEETPLEEETTRDIIAEVSRRVRGVKVTKEPGE